MQGQKEGGKGQTPTEERVIEGREGEDKGAKERRERKKQGRLRTEGAKEWGEEKRKER